MDSQITLRTLIKRANISEQEFADAIFLPKNSDIQRLIDQPRDFSVPQAQRAYDILNMTPEEGCIIFFENLLTEQSMNDFQIYENSPLNNGLSKEDFDVIARTWRKLRHISDNAVIMKRSQSGAGALRRARLERRLCDNRIDELHSEMELIRRLDRVRGFIRQRPENERDVLYGRYVMGLGWAKVAKRAGFSVDHCYTLHRAALRSLNDTKDD